MLTKFLRPVVATVALSTSAVALAGTLELSLQGLNCALCGDQMKAALKKLSGADAVIPHLECGKLFLDMPAGAKVDEGQLGIALLSEGFTLNSVKPTNMSLAQAKDLTC